MGGRQSSQSNNPRQQSNVSDPSSSRYSVGSLDNEPSVGGSRAVLFSGPSGSIDLGGSPSGAGVVRRRRRRDRNDMFIETHSLPAHLFPTALLSANIKCPVCNKRIASNEVESHLLICLAKPKVSYNEDVLTADAGECIICFDDMCQGDRIARLQCLCIYHKHCLDEWFQRNRCCPEHPDQAPQEYMETLPRNTSSRTTRVPLDTSLSLNDSNESSSEALLDSPPPPLVTNSLPTTITLSGEHLSPDRQLDVDAHTNSPSTSSATPRTEDFENDTPTTDGANDVESTTSQSDDVNDTSMSSLLDDVVGRSTNSPFTVMLETDDDSALATTVVGYNEDTIGSSTVVGDNEDTIGSSTVVGDNEDTIGSSTAVVASDRSPVVHVDEGSTHGTTSLFNEEEFAQLTSRKMNLFRNDDPGPNEVDDT